MASRFSLPHSRLAALSGQQIARASDQDLYTFALRYAQAHALNPTGVAGAGGGPGAAPSFNPAVRLELGRQSSAHALARRKALAASLANRTTEGSRRRALARLTAGYGITV